MLGENLQDVFVAYANQHLMTLDMVKHLWKRATYEDKQGVINWYKRGTHVDNYALIQSLRDRVAELEKELANG